MMAGEDGPVSFDVYGGVYTVTGVDERREEQAKRVMVPDQQSIVLDQLERPVGGLQDNYHVVSQNGDTVEGTQDALARDLIERLHAESVSTVFVSALTDVLNAHWSVGRTPRQHNF